MRFLHVLFLDEPWLWVYGVILNQRGVCDLVFSMLQSVVLFYSVTSFVAMFSLRIVVQCIHFWLEVLGVD